jgi:hypothetical protein
MIPNFRFAPKAWPYTQQKSRKICCRDAPDTGTVFAGYMANPKAGYRISGRIFVLTNIFLVKYKITFFKKL